MNGKRIAALIGGVVAAAAVLMHPLEELAEELLSVHMVNHEVLIFVTAPLLAFGLGGVVNARFVPGVVRQVIRGLTVPVVALVISTMALWAWHHPAAYDLALEDERVHALEHLTFVAGFTVFWWPLVNPSGRRLVTRASRVLYLVASATQSSVLGAIIAFSPEVIYPFYEGGHHGGAADPLHDQMLAGMVMLLSGSVVYLFGAFWVAGTPGVPAAVEPAPQYSSRPIG